MAYDRAGWGIRVEIPPCFSLTLSICMLPRRLRVPVKTFRELYCEHHGIAYEKFERVLLWRCLHWQARPIYWLLGLNRDYYSADFDFIRGVGDLRRRSDFRNEAAEFHYHPGNRGFLRTMLRMRLSSHRLQAAFEREISSTNTTPPMPA